MTGYNLAGTGAMRCLGRAVEKFKSELGRRVLTRGGVTFSFAVLLCRIIRLGGSCSTAKRLGLRGMECRLFLLASESMVIYSYVIVIQDGIFTV